MGTNGKKRRSKAQVRKDEALILEDMRVRLAENGHFIEVVSKRHRRDSRAFIAIPKDNPRRFVLVEPKDGGRVHVVPFCAQTLYCDVKEIVSALRNKHSKRVHWSKQLGIRRQNLELRHFLTPKGEERIRTLLGYPQKQKPAHE